MTNNKDWKGNAKAVFVCNGAAGHAQEEREEHDFYATSPEAAELLLEVEPQLDNIWEPFVGEGHLAEVFRNKGKLKAASDLIDRGYRPDIKACSYGKDFFKLDKVWKGDIVSNPPYAMALESVQHALDLIEDGHYLAYFMKITFLEGKGRKQFFLDNPPIRVWVSSSRIPCAKNGKFTELKKNSKGELVETKVSSAACYCWFVWQKGYKGPTELKWFN